MSVCGGWEAGENTGMRQVEAGEQEHFGSSPGYSGTACPEKRSHESCGAVCGKLTRRGKRTSVSPTHRECPKKQKETEIQPSKPRREEV